MGGSHVYQRNPLEGLGITLANFEVKLFDYTEKVRAQISTQQTALMAVARAKAQQAEQEALMAEAEGKANVARAKYEARISNLIQTSRPSGGLERLYS